MRGEIKVLDCTLRDGGYYNNWCFSNDLVSDYFRSVITARIDIIEIGLRSLSTNDFYGPFAYTTDKFVKKLQLPSHLKLAVMINAKEYLSVDNVPTAIKENFDYRKNSQVGLVRIAASFGEIFKIKPIISTLQELGYGTVVNVMQIANRSDNEIREVSQELAKYDLECLYFADSFGNLSPNRICSIVDIIKSEWNGEIGIHTHDNMGKAFENSISAIGNGVSWVDSTILGMGRGAGNAKTENILLELNSRTPGKFLPEALFNLVLGPFKNLKQKYNWGENLIYFISAQHGIHPSFVQELLGNQNYDIHDLMFAINALKNSDNAGKYSSSNLKNAIDSSYKSAKGSWSPKVLMAGKDVLLLGAGPGLKENVDAIKSFILEKKPLVISLNIQNIIENNLIDVYIGCHPTRIYTEASKYKELTKPVIIPKQSVPETVLEIMSEVPIWDFGLTVEDSKLSIENMNCVIPKLLVLPYALAVCMAGQARNVWLAGFDGYGRGDQRQDEINNVISLYNKIDKAPQLTAITATTYEVNKNSVYNPTL